MALRNEGRLSQEHCVHLRSDGLRFLLLNKFCELFFFGMYLFELQLFLSCLFANNANPTQPCDISITDCHIFLHQKKFVKKNTGLHEGRDSV